jgi:hypothetical protein
MLQGRRTETAQPENTSTCSTPPTPPAAKTITLADLIDNTRTIAINDRGFWGRQRKVDRRSCGCCGKVIGPCGEWLSRYVDPLTPTALPEASRAGRSRNIEVMWLTGKLSPDFKPLHSSRGNGNYGVG